MNCRVRVALRIAEDKFSESEGEDELDSMLEDVKTRERHIKAQLDEKDSEVPLPELTDEQVEKLTAAIKKPNDAIPKSAVTENMLKATAGLVKVLKKAG